VYGWNSEFTGDAQSTEKQLGSPANAKNVITVGSYDWNDNFHQHGRPVLLTDPIYGREISVGALSSYSSPGPLRIGNAAKPEIVAPGQWYTAPATTNVPTTRDSTGHYQAFNGTSAATPYAAGVIALLLQKQPTLTFGDIRTRLKECATRDAETGNVPNAKWGQGKFDIKAVKKLLNVNG